MRHSSIKSVIKTKNTKSWLMYSSITSKMKKKLRHWLGPLTELTTKFRNLIIGIKNLIAYAPIIFKDRDWDDSYFLRLMEFKLSRMEHLFEHHGHHLNHKRDAKRVRIAKNLCKRIYEDDYWTLDMNAHNRKWGELYFDSKPTNHPNASEMVFRYENAKTPEEQEQASKEARVIYKRYENHQKNDLKYLCNHLNKWLFTFWD